MPHQDGLLSLVDEILLWSPTGKDLQNLIDAVIFTLKYCHKFYVEKVSAGTRAKSSAVAKPIFSSKFGKLFG